MFNGIREFPHKSVINIEKGVRKDDFHTDSYDWSTCRIHSVLNLIVYVGGEKVEHISKNFKRALCNMSVNRLIYLIRVFIVNYMVMSSII